MDKKSYFNTQDRVALDVCDEGEKSPIRTAWWKRVISVSPANHYDVAGLVPRELAILDQLTDIANGKYGIDLGSKPVFPSTVSEFVSPDAATRYGWVTNNPKTTGILASNIDLAYMYKLCGWKTDESDKYNKLANELASNLVAYAKHVQLDQWYGMELNILTTGNVNTPIDTLMDWAMFRAGIEWKMLSATQKIQFSAMATLAWLAARGMGHLMGAPIRSLIFVKEGYPVNLADRVVVPIGLVSANPAILDWGDRMQLAFPGDDTFTSAQVQIEVIANQGFTSVGTVERIGESYKYNHTATARLKKLPWRNYLTTSIEQKIATTFTITKTPSVAALQCAGLTGAQKYSYFKAPLTRFHLYAGMEVELAYNDANATQNKDKYTLELEKAQSTIKTILGV